MSGVCMNVFLYRTRKCLIVGLILLFILLYLWPPLKLTFGRHSGQQFLIPHKWLSATSHPLGINYLFPACNILLYYV